MSVVPWQSYLGVTGCNGLAADNKDSVEQAGNLVVRCAVLLGRSLHLVCSLGYRFSAVSAHAV